jgi:hypothetical protein
MPRQPTRPVTLRALLIMLLRVKLKVVIFQLPGSYGRGGRDEPGCVSF